ncbi:hypothetical protein [Cohnella cellulosilytica]|uniref:Uncharacterized protein n=1 Tax=Cohnella cellulosilytica TaxID=986710 RepID=A0ABW2FBD7_9BACL
MDNIGLQKEESSGKGFARIATFVYAFALLVTAALVLLLGLPYARLSHTLITLSALMLGETFLYGITLHYLANRPRSRRLIPVYIAMGIVAGLYWIGAFVFAMVFSWALDVSTFHYALAQFMILGAAAIVLGLLAMYMKNAALQEKGS